MRAGQRRAEDWSLAAQSAAAMRADSHLNLEIVGGRVDSLGVCIDSPCARFYDRRPLFRYLLSFSEPICFRERAHGREECVEQLGTHLRMESLRAVVLADYNCMRSLWCLGALMLYRRVRVRPEPVLCQCAWAVELWQGGQREAACVKEHAAGLAGP